MSFSSGCWPLIASRSLSVANTGQLAYIHPSYSTMEEPYLLSVEDRYHNRVVQVLHLSSDQRGVIEPKICKDIPTQGDTISPA